ncbi:MAG: glycosyltransferase family 2 protein [Pirellulales bacterium]
MSASLQARPTAPAPSDVLGLWRAAAVELSAIARYYDRAIEWRVAENDGARLLEGVDCAAKLSITRLDQLPNVRSEEKKRTLIVVDAIEDDRVAIMSVLAELRPLVNRSARLALIGPAAAACAGEPPGWQIVRARPIGFMGRAVRAAGPLMDKLVRAPTLLHRAKRGETPHTVRAARRAPRAVTVLRPVLPEPAGSRPSLSIIIPARNERGNITHALARLPDFGGAGVEVIFVEGHSTDGTWEEIERVVSQYRGDCKRAKGLRVRALRQTGHGKADAVRVGFAAATCDLLAVLDADLTMPPEALAEFYRAYCDGRGDFINGDRLSLPMEPGAMRPLNKVGNRFFAWALSHVLETPLADCLCGTKLFARHDWQRFEAWRADFGYRDPFGDFDLLFPAAALALGCVNVPVRYAARTYGRTNIRRFRDGARLLAMTLEGWWRLHVYRGAANRRDV